MSLRVLSFSPGRRLSQLSHRTLVKLVGNTDLARAVDVKVVTSKENLHFDNQVNSLFLFFVLESPKRKRKHVLRVSVEFQYKSTLVVSRMSFSDWLRYSLSIL